MKKYISHSTVSFSVAVGKGQRRIRFMSDSRGGSTFMCDDPVVCKAIEARSDFNRLYRLDPKWEGNIAKGGKTQQGKTQVPAPAKPNAPVEPAPAPDETIDDSAAPAPDETIDDSAAPTVTVVEEVQTLGEAKEYLIGLGANAFALTKKAGILEAAAKFNVSFPNLQ